MEKHSNSMLGLPHKSLHSYIYAFIFCIIYNFWEYGNLLPLLPYLPVTWPNNPTEPGSQKYHEPLLKEHH